MEELIEELKRVVKFRDTTDDGDIVLIVTENPQAFLYGIVKGFERDDSRRDEWWHVSLQLLTVPPSQAVWTLRREQFTGQEIFTMGGNKRFIKAVDLESIQPAPAPEDKSEKKPERPQLKVVK